MSVHINNLRNLHKIYLANLTNLFSSRLKDFRGSDLYVIFYVFFKITCIINISILQYVILINNNNIHCLSKKSSHL